MILFENNYIGTFNFSAKVDRVFDGYLSGLVAVIVDKFLDKKLSNDFFGLELNFFITNGTFYERRKLAFINFGVSVGLDCFNLRGRENI